MKKHLLFILKTLVITVLLTSVIGISGCRSGTTDDDNESTASPYSENSFDIRSLVASPAVVPDGNGGVLVIYAELEQEYEQVLHARRIDRSGNSVWDKVLGKGHSFIGDHLTLIDGGNGAVITYARVSPVDNSGPDETIFKISFEGNIVWQTTLPVNRSIEAITPDGSGGAIFSYRDSSQQDNCYIQKADSQGYLLWGEDELIIRRDNYQFQSIRLIRDDSGEAIITWHERGDDPVSRVCGQKVDPEGNFVWEGQSIIKKGKVLYTSDRISEGQQGEMTGDGSGGALLAWIENNRTPPVLFHVIAMRINSDGVSRWVSQAELGTEASETGYVAFPFVIRDGTEILLFWSNVNTIYARKLDESGEPLWLNNGIVVWQDQDALRLGNQVIKDGFGNVFVIWSCIEKDPSPEETKIGIQKLDFEGTSIWDAEGKPVETKDDTFSTLADAAADGEGGIFITWTSGPELGSSEDTYIQKINEDGSPAWEPDGIKLNR
jgi:hypothetical protein